MIVTEPYEPLPERYPGGRAFGATIRGRRMGAGVTLRRCAERMGVSMYRLSQIEQGQESMTEAEFKAFGRAISVEKQA